MAPEVARGSRKPRENQYIFDLGVKGRKTGLTLPDTGIRDENGLEPMDHLFSSPEKPATRRRTNGVYRNANATISSEEDMDMGESTVPEPTAVLTARQSTRLPPPRSKSPIKTFLKSPARRNPSLGPISSPLRGSIVAPKTASVTASVRRKLDFSTEELEANVFESSSTKGSPHKRGNSRTNAQFKLSNRKHPGLRPSALTYDGADEAEDVYDDTALDNGGGSFQMINGGDEEEVEQIEEQQELELEPEFETHLPKKGRGRPKGKGKEKEVEPEPDIGVEVEPEPESELEAEPEPEPVKTTKTGRGKTRKEPSTDTEEPPAKKIRRSIENGDPAPKLATKSKAVKATKQAPKAKATAKKSKLAAIAETESPNIQHAPPLPRNNRGLFILRRETPMEGSSFTQSRYGRNSVKPVAWWKNEKIEYSEEEAEDGDNKFLLQKIKEVVRKDEVEDTRPKRTQQKPIKGKGKKRVAAIGEEDEDEAEPWEADPGFVYADIRQWDPIDPVGVEAPEEEQEVAWSSAAIITKDVAGANFGFAKCLTMPFFGAGMVDFPVGAIKKPKNTRKMQMVFFVFTGRVQVTINGGEPFRISKGGMWQVPRGNFYSIYNDGTKPARVFFSQGCEIEEVRLEDEE